MKGDINLLREDFINTKAWITDKLNRMEEELFSSNSEDFYEGMEDVYILQSLVHKIVGHFKENANQSFKLKLESNIYSKTFEFLNKLKCADFGVNTEIETVRLSLKFHKEMRNCLEQVGICNQIEDRRLDDTISYIYAAITQIAGDLTLKEFVDLTDTNLTKVDCFSEENRELTGKFIEVLDERLRQIYSTEDLIAMTGLDSVVAIANAVIICSAFSNVNMTSKHFCKDVLKPSLGLIGVDTLFNDNLLQVLSETCEDFIINYMPNNLKLNISPVYIKEFYPPIEERPPFKIRLYLLVKNTFSSLVKTTLSVSDLERITEAVASSYSSQEIDSTSLIYRDIYSAIDNLDSDISDNKKDNICEQIMRKIPVIIFEDENIVDLCKYLECPIVPDKPQELDLDLRDKLGVVGAESDTLNGDEVTSF